MTDQKTSSEFGNVDDDELLTLTGEDSDEEGQVADQPGTKGYSGAMSRRKFTAFDRYILTKDSFLFTSRQMCCAIISFLISIIVTNIITYNVICPSGDTILDGTGIIASYVDSTTYELESERVYREFGVPKDEKANDLMTYVELSIHEGSKKSDIDKFIKLVSNDKDKDVPGIRLHVSETETTIKLLTTIRENDRLKIKPISFNLDRYISSAKIVVDVDFKPSFLNSMNAGAGDLMSGDEFWGAICSIFPALYIAEEDVDKWVLFGTVIQSVDHWGIMVRSLNSGLEMKLQGMDHRFFQFFKTIKVNADIECVEGNKGRSQNIGLLSHQSVLGLLEDTLK